ncbi:MAG TPA: prepilin-type N-terminal cleavage/methylation domain-containing protein [Pyrinomonadaceae bacterium]
MNGEQTDSGAARERTGTMMKDSLRHRLSASRRLRIAASRAAGFTLLELMIVISIIVILATVALPQYQKATRHAKETVLRDDLFQMRKLIDQYAADKGKLPQSLDELVTAGYMREIPEDPITGEKNWAVETGDDPASLEGGTGIINVRSASADSPPDSGTPYNEW